MSLTMIITNAGRAALLNASNTGTAPVTISHFGLSEAALVPSPAATTLPGEVKRIATLSGDIVADDTIHLIVRDQSADAYSMRSWALYLQDGTLFGIYGQASPILTKTDASMMLLAVDVTFADIDATLLTFGDTNFLNPPATTEVQGVVELATSAETIAGTDPARAVTPSTLAALYTAANVLAKLLTVDGSGSGLDADLLRGLTPEQVVNATRIVGGLGYAPATGSGFMGNGDMNTVVNSGIYRFNQPTNGPPGEEWGQLLVLHGASDTITQIVGSISGNLWVRAGSPALVGGIGSWSAWKGLVTAGAPIAYTAADVLAKLITVDGSGSGVDADLHRGMTPEQVVNAARIIAGLGWTPVQQGTGVGQLANAVKLGWDGGWLRATVDSTDLGWLITNLTLASALLDVNGSTMRRNGHHLYGPDNDGSGSVLDADLLDGLHASDFALLSGFENGSNANGYWRKTPDGVIEQWGVVTGSFGEGPVYRDFPIPFTEAASISVGITALNPSGAGWNDMWTQTAPPTLTTFTAIFQATSSGNTGFGFHWRAVGR